MRPVVTRQATGDACQATFAASPPISSALDGGTPAALPGGVRSWWMAVLLACGKDQAPAPPVIDPMTDPDGVIREAFRVTHEHASNEHVSGIVVRGVRADGQLDPVRGEIHILYQRAGSALCTEDIWWATGRKQLQILCNVGVLVHAPKCSLAQVWRTAVAERPPGDQLATIRVLDSQTSRPGWSIWVGEEFYNFVADDCR